MANRARELYQTSDVREANNFSIFLADIAPDVYLSATTKCELGHRNYDAHAVLKYDSGRDQCRGRKERGLLVGKWMVKKRRIKKWRVCRQNGN